MFEVKADGSTLQLFRDDTLMDAYYINAKIIDFDILVNKVVALDDVAHLHYFTINEDYRFTFEQCSITPSITSKSVKFIEDGEKVELSGEGIKFLSECFI